jgi:hypothetical protein
MSSFRSVQRDHARIADRGRGMRTKVGFAIGVTAVFALAGCKSADTPVPLASSSLPSTTTSGSAEKTTSSPPKPSGTTGSTRTGSTATTSTASSALSSPIADASATRDALLELATGSTIVQSGNASGFVTAWEPYGNSLGFAGSGVTATATSISGFQFVLSKAKEISYLGFAVADSAGRCSGGVLESTDDDAVSKVVPVDGLTVETCSGTGASDAAGY